MSYVNSQRVRRAARAARERERYSLARAAAASPPLPDVADGGATSGGDAGAFGGASDDDADMREALEASCFDVGARDVHDDAALLARLRRATELSLADAARAERADAAADDDLRAALHASAASASSDDADGADILRAMRSSRRVARRVAARVRSRSDDETIDYYTALSNSERDGVRDTDGERDSASAPTWVPLSAAPYLMLTTRALAALQSPRPLPPLLLLAARPRSDLGPLGTLIAPRLRRFRLPRSLASASVSSSTRERRRALVSKILHPFAAAHRSTPHTPVCLALSASLLRELILWLQTCGAWTPFPLLHRALRQM